MVLDKIFPKQSETYYHVTEDLLIEHKKYDICAKYIGDPIIKYEDGVDAQLRPKGSLIK